MSRNVRGRARRRIKLAHEGRESAPLARAPSPRRPGSRSGEGSSGRLRESRWWAGDCAWHCGRSPRSGHRARSKAAASPHWLSSPNQRLWLGMKPHHTSTA